MFRRSDPNRPLNHWWLVLLFPFLALLFIGSPAYGQTPFYTDDADVTSKGHFHFEFSNEFDWLQRSSIPNLRQNTADFTLAYGLAKNLEISIESPWLTIYNEPGTIPLTPSGIGVNCKLCLAETISSDTTSLSTLVYSAENSRRVRGLA